MRATQYLLMAAVALVGLVAHTTPNDAEDRRCAPATSQDAYGLYARYADLLRHGDAEAIAALYSPDAILMGPGAQTVRIGRSEIAEYYSALASRVPTVAPLERVVRTECGGLAVSGIEVLSFRSMQGETVSQIARFSFTYESFDDRWLIVHHHQDVSRLNSEFDAPAAPVAPSEIVTGANPPQAQPSTPLSPNPVIALPPSAYRLPASAPVILSATRPLLPLPEVATPVDVQTIDRSPVLVLSPPLHAKDDVDVPRTAFARGLGDPAIVKPWIKEAEVEPRARVYAAPLNSAPIAGALASVVLPVDLPVELPVINLPAAAFGLEPHPPNIEAFLQPQKTNPAQTIPALTVATTIGTVVNGTTVTDPTVTGSTVTGSTVTGQAATQQFDRQPAYAPAALPPPTAQPKAQRAEFKSNAAVRARTAKNTLKEPPKKTGVFLRWDDRTPVFDDWYQHLVWQQWATLGGHTLPEEWPFANFVQM